MPWTPLGVTITGAQGPAGTAGGVGPSGAAGPPGAAGAAGPRGDGMQNRPSAAVGSLLYISGSGTVSWWAPTNHVWMQMNGATIYETGNTLFMDNNRLYYATGDVNNRYIYASGTTLRIKPGTSTPDQYVFGNTGFANLSGPGISHLGANAKAWRNVRYKTDRVVVSDERTKDDIKDFDFDALDQIRRAKPKRWKWKHDQSDAVGYVATDFDEPIQIVEDGVSSISDAARFAVMWKALADLNARLEAVS